MSIFLGSLLKTSKPFSPRTRIGLANRWISFFARPLISATLRPRFSPEATSQIVATLRMTWAQSPVQLRLSWPLRPPASCRGCTDTTWSSPFSPVTSRQRLRCSPPVPLAMPSPPRPSYMMPSTVRVPAMLVSSPLTLDLALMQLPQAIKTL